MKISIDTRTIKKGEYFVPIKGPNFDGHSYVKNALKKGAKGIIEEEEFYRLAKDKLNKTKPIIIGIAGSIGKSTFRSYLYSILKSKFDVLESDLNTKLGFALKIINEFEKQKIIVAEIGIDRLGEMEETSKFISPDFAVITKLGKEHLEFLKNFKNVINENLKIINNCKLKLCYLNKKDKKYYDKLINNNQNIIYFPKTYLSTLVDNKIKSLIIPNHEKDYLKAIYQIVSDRFAFSDQEFVLSLNNLVKLKGRLNILKGKNRSIIIDDTYNAVCDQTIIEGIKDSESPEIFQKAIVEFARYEGEVNQKKVFNFLSELIKRGPFLVSSRLPKYLSPVLNSETIQMYETILDHIPRNQERYKQLYLVIEEKKTLLNSR